MRRDNSGKRGWRVPIVLMVMLILTLSVFTVWIAVVPVGANAQQASVTRDLPDSVEPNETFAVNLTQSGFFWGIGIVWEVLPEGFEYVVGSYTGGSPDKVTYDPITRTLEMPFSMETSIAYSVNASSYDQTAEFSGTWRTADSQMNKINGSVVGDTEVVVGVDGTPPYTDEHNPAKDATDVPVDTNVIVHVKDNFEVNASTIKMTVKGNLVSPLIEPEDSGPDDWVVTYDPIVDFNYGEVVNVTIDASDAAGNAMPTDVYSFTTVEEKKPDLIVTEITLNCGYLFANESNDITATIKNNGTADTGVFNVSFVIGEVREEVRVNGLALSTSTTVCVNDSTERNAGESVTITVIADCTGEISEANETNNITVRDETVVNNGYKGKRYTGGEDITTWKTFELNGNVLYSLGDSYYLSGATGWTTYTANWTASNLPVPGGASVKEARLYVIYKWDKAGVMPDEVSLTFYGIAQTRDKHYSDGRVVPDSKPYGMLAYNVTADFAAGENSAMLTNSHPGGGNVSIRGMLLMVIYEEAGEAKRKIFVNEGFDLLYGGSSNCTTPEEATAYAPFAGAIEDIGIKSVRLITVAPGAGYPSPNEGELIFNGHVWTGVWSIAGATQIGIDDRDITAYLNTTNEAGFQSSADYMEASNAILVVETIMVIPLPGHTNPPTDPDGDGIYEDMNGNGRLDFDDVVQFFDNMEWIGANEPVWYFDFNGNERIDFDDIVKLFKKL